MRAEWPAGKGGRQVSDCDVIKHHFGPQAMLGLGRTDGRIEFDAVTFGYDPSHPVLRDLTIEVKPGQMVALVWPTGSGKSSAMALIQRFYDVTSGAVCVGGQDVRDVTQASLGAQIAMVLQDPFLFTGTVLENICYNKVSATRDQVIAAGHCPAGSGSCCRLPARW